MGNAIVNPSAWPRGMIVTLWRGSQPGNNLAVSACPASCTAVIRFSFSDMIIDLRSGPINTLSLAASKSPMSTRSLDWRAAKSAASLTKFSKSAPVIPGVPRPITSRSTSEASGTRRVWTARIPTRPRRSGRGTTMRRSKRPGRCSAGSRTSGRLAAAKSRAAVTTDGVDLVDKDDARRVLLALLEEIAHPRRPHPDEHLDEVGPGDGEKRNARLTCHRFGEQRLARSGRPHHQNALGDATAELGEFFRVLEKSDDLLELFLGLINAGDVSEGNLVVALGEQLGFRLAKGHRFAAGALQLPHEEDEEEEEEDDRHPLAQDGQPDAVLLLLLVLEVDLLIAQKLHHRGVGGRSGGAKLLVAVGEGTRVDVALDRNASDLLVLDFREELGERRLLDLLGAVGEEIVERDEKDDQNDPEADRLVARTHVSDAFQPSRKRYQQRRI